MTIFNQLVEKSIVTDYFVYSDGFSKYFFKQTVTHASDKKTSDLLAELFEDKKMQHFRSEILSKRGYFPFVIGLTGAECKKRGISKGFTTARHNSKNDEKQYVIYYNSSLPRIDSKIFIVIELMNYFNWEKYESFVELAKKGKICKKKFAYLCEANEWQNLHLASDFIFRLAPYLRKTSFEQMANDFDSYYRAQKNSGHTRKYVIQYHVLRAVWLFKRLLVKN